ncbi:MAG: YidH family protein [Leptolyngbyaceae cyanobacterium]
MITAPDPPDPQTELAKERNRIAADRTLLTWVRTSVSLIGMGFGITQLSPPLDLEDQGFLLAMVTPSKIGLFFIGLGVFSVVFAALDYQAELGRYRQPTYTYTPRLSLGLSIAGAVVIVALILFAALWTHPFLRSLHRA